MDRRKTIKIPKIELPDSYEILPNKRPGASLIYFATNGQNRFVIIFDDNILCPHFKSGYDEVDITLKDGQATKALILPFNKRLPKCRSQKKEGVG